LFLHDALLLDLLCFHRVFNPIHNIAKFPLKGNFMDQSYGNFAL